jgi:hypothetical protein
VTEFIGVGELGVSATESDLSAVFPVGATIDRLYVYTEGNTTGTYTIMIDGSASTVTCTTSNTQICTDTTHSAAISAGQTISLRVTNSHTDLMTHWRARYH